MSDAEAVRAEWSDGDYPAIAERLRPAAETLIRALGRLEGVELLDVATGTGNVAMAAARAGADHVVGVDLTPELLTVAREAADREGLDAVEFVEGDAEALDFEEDRFDVVTSTFGVIFAPRPAVAAGELARVLTPGGRLGLTTWPEGSTSARMGALVAQRLPQQRSEPRLAPIQWSSEDHIRALFAQRGVDLSFQRHVLHWHFPDAQSAGAFAFDKVAGMRAARAMLDAEAADGLRSDLIALFAERAAPAGSGIAVPFEYLLTRGVKVGA